MNKIVFWDFIKVYFRSFLYQNLLNEKYMQNFGFLYVMYPIIKKFSKTKEDLKRNILEHFEYFNTNPYFASFIFGVSMNLFEQGGSSKLKKFKFETMTSFAGIGDALSWGIIRSYLALIGLGMVLFHRIWGIVIFLIVYNLILNIFFRFFGIIFGYKNGQRVIFQIAEMDIQKIIYILKQSGLFVLGVLFFVLLRFKYQLVVEIEYMSVYRILQFIMFLFIVYIFYNINKKFIPVVSYLVYFIVIALLVIKF